MYQPITPPAGTKLDRAGRVFQHRPCQHVPGTRYNTRLSLPKVAFEELLFGGCDDLVTDISMRSRLYRPRPSPSDKQQS